MTGLQFFVAGVPAPKGSMKAFMPKGGRFPIVTNDNAKSKPWASLVSLTATQSALACGWKLTGSPVTVRMVFNMPRPASHYGSGKNADKVRASAPREHTTKPDLDKLARCVGDALTGIVYVDDSQIVGKSLRKEYAVGQPGVAISVAALAVAITAAESNVEISDGER